MLVILLLMLALLACHRDSLQRYVEAQCCIASNDYKGELSLDYELQCVHSTKLASQKCLYERKFKSIFFPFWILILVLTESALIS